MRKDVFSNEGQIAILIRTFKVKKECQKDRNAVLFLSGAEKFLLPGVILLVYILDSSVNA